MAIQTGAGVTIAIATTIKVGSPQVVPSTLAHYRALTWTNLLGEVSEIGEHGDERTPVPWISLADGRVRKARGSADAGDLQLTFAYDAADIGQIALKAAFDVTSQALDQYPFRVRFNDATGTGSPANVGTTEYFGARVMSLRTQSISNDGVITRVAVLSINTEIVTSSPT